jgi:abhydrolase domain-containing protein 12
MAEQGQAGRFVRLVEALHSEGGRYSINIIHAEDDYDIPWSHSDQVFWHAVDAASPQGISYDELEKEKLETRQVLGHGGWMANWKTGKGVIREEIVKYGLHERIMSYPVVSLAVVRAFQRA